MTPLSTLFSRPPPADNRDGTPQHKGRLELLRPPLKGQLSARAGRMTGSKQHENTVRSSVGPDPGPDDLSLIRRFTLTDIPPEKLYVRRVALANDALDRQWERIPKPFLERLALTLPGKSLLVSHDKKALAKGLWYAGSVRKALEGEAGEWTLEGRFYVLKSPENQEIRDSIDAGVIRHTSISFSYAEKACSVCGGDADTCPHLPGETLGDQSTAFLYAGDLNRYETKEASLVYLGAQRGSEITKSAERTFPMDELEKAKAEIKRLTEELTAAKAAAARLPETEKSLEEANTACKKHQDDAEASKAQIAALQSDTATKSLVADGQAYRDHLKTEVKRLAGILHREKQVEPILHLTAAAGTEALKSLHDGLLSEVDEKFPPKAIGNPMSTDKGDDERTSPQPGIPFSLL